MTGRYYAYRVRGLSTTMQTWRRRLMDGTFSTLLDPVPELCSTTAQRAFFSTSLGLRKARVQPFLVLHTSKLDIDQSS